MIEEGEPENKERFKKVLTIRRRSSLIRNNLEVDLMSLGKNRNLDDIMRGVNSLLKRMAKPTNKMKESFYESKNIMNKIINGLYVGRLKAGHDLEALKKNGITNIVQVLRNDIRHAPRFPDEINYHYIKVSDNETESLYKHLFSAIYFIERALVERKQSVLIHCQLGASASVAVAIAYLVFKNKVSVESAWKIIQKERHVAYPNRGFLYDVILFQKLCEENRDIVIAQMEKKSENSTNTYILYKESKGEKFSRELKQFFCWC